jgi:imidazolonepropionase-like amidohydrolase
MSDAPKITALTNCHVIDCTGRAPMRDMTVVIEGKTISEIAPSRQYRTASHVRVLDMTGTYLLPGLWAVHTHLGDIFPDPRRLTLRETVAERTIRAGRTALDALRTGVTGIRVVGERDYIDVAWKRAFDAGILVGPRLVTCGRMIIATGGHGHGSGFHVEVDGPYEMRKAVRTQLKYGADQIKLCVTGGVSTAGETMQETQLCRDEVEAATEVAHAKGKRVCVHAGGPPGIKMAIRSGVDCIEHGYYLDDEAIELMVKHDVFFVPTINVTQDETFMRKSKMEGFQIEKARRAAKHHLDGFQKALKAGVKIACGPDSSPIGEITLGEIELLVKAGMTEMQALIAATRTSAELCGVGDRIGTLEVGKLADLIAVTENPLEDVSRLRQLRLVMKDGGLVDTREPEGLTDFWDLFF